MSIGLAHGIYSQVMSGLGSVYPDIYPDSLTRIHKLH